MEKLKTGVDKRLSIDQIWKMDRARSVVDKLSYHGLLGILEQVQNKLEDENQQKLIKKVLLFKNFHIIKYRVKKKIFFFANFQIHSFDPKNLRKKKTEYSSHFHF